MDYIIIAVIAVIVLAVIAIIIWRKVKGKSSCGCDCGSCKSCPSSSACNGNCSSCNSCPPKKEKDE